MSGAYISQVKVNSALDFATIELERKWTSQRGKVSDLPEDMRQSLRRWILDADPEPPASDLLAVCEVCDSSVRVTSWQQLDRWHFDVGWFCPNHIEEAK